MPTPHKPLRVLVWYWGRKGAGPLYALELMRALRAQPDIQVSGSIAAGSELRRETEALGVPLDSVPTYHDRTSFALATLRLPLVRARFKQFLKQNKFDIVLSTMPHFWTPLMVDCVTASGARYIPVLHDAMPHPGEAQPLWNWRRRQETQRASAIICLSSAVADGVARQTSYPRDNIAIIPYGIPTMTGLRPTPRTYPQERPFRFMFFGRIMDYKGLDTLLEAYAQLYPQTLSQSSPPQASIELWVVGAGDVTPYQAALQKLSGITLVNRWIEEQEIPHFLNQADAIVLPYREASQSGVTSQAYAAGLPVIVTPVGGLQEQVIDGETGVIAATDSPAALTTAMQRLLDPVLYAQLAHGAMRQRDTWSFAAQGKIYADLFRKTAARR